MPVIVWLAYGVHGNEISSPDASLLAAYHLLASRNDRVVDKILAHTLVLIAPVQNPDGRELLRIRSESLFGFQPADRETRIMVTLPADGGDGGDLVHRMVPSVGVGAL